MRASPATPPTVPPTTAGVAGLERLLPPDDAAVVEELGAVPVAEAETPPTPIAPVLEAPAALLPDAVAPEAVEKALLDVTDAVPKMSVLWRERLDELDSVDVRS